jgi:hypothetical protein
MKKALVGVGLILLIFGTILVLYSPEEVSFEEETVSTWNSIASSSLMPPPDPHNATFWGVLVPPASRFELNISSSAPLRVIVSATESSTQTLISIFDETGVSFTQIVPEGDTPLDMGTYNVEIRNEGSTVVNILPGSTVTAIQLIAEKHASYLYQASGVLAIFCGMIILLLGVFIKSKTKRLRGHSHKGWTRIVSTRHS